jgi:hypothetical protein
MAVQAQVELVRRLSRNSGTFPSSRGSELEQMNWKT